MSLKPNETCELCLAVTSYMDCESGKIYTQRNAHTDDACALEVKALTFKFRQEIIRLNDLLHEERVRLKTFEANHRGRKAPPSQEHHLIDQCQRWQSMYERERMRGYWLRNKIMKVYGTLDLRIESGYIVDEKAKNVAEYVTRKLREVLKDKIT